MQKAFVFIVFVLIATTAFSQKKKTIKKYNIRSIVVTETTGNKTITDSKAVYDANGLLVEEVNYDKDGKFKSRTKYKYNPLGDVVEENGYDETGKKLVEKHIIKYDALGEKKEELVQDGNGRQIKKITYTYNSKGLKAEKKTFDANNNLVSTRKIAYTFK